MSANMDKLIDDIVRQVIGERAPKKALSNMNLETAKYIIDKVEKKAEEMGVRAVVAIAEAGGNIIAVESMDDAYFASYDIATNKAYTCVALKMSTKKLSTLSLPGQSLYGIQFTNQGRIVIFGGGDPLLSQGRVIGAVGVSGGSEEQDTALSAYAKEVFEEIIE